jgi:peptidoglycan/LPS O-acetylase OafA/YrhL
MLAGLALLFFGISCGGYWLFFSRAVPVFTWNDVWCYGAIALGALLYLLNKKEGAFWSRHRGWGWAAVGAGGLAVLAGGSGLFKGECAILAAPVMDLGLFLALLGGLSLPFFESGWLKLLALPGRYSYGLYLFHVAILYLMRPWLAGLSTSTSVFLSFGIYAVAATCVAALSYHYFEVPANKAVRGRFGIS